MTEKLTRREILKGLSCLPVALPFMGLMTPGIANAAKGSGQTSEGSQIYTLPPLPYPYDALEPYIDKKTLTIHYGKHHAGYVKKFNHALRKLMEIRNSGDYALIKHWTKEASFNGSGHVLHTLYWESMSPNGGGKPGGLLAKAIKRDFGGIKEFKEQFMTAAKSVEGSGWGILAYEPLGKRLTILQAEKHQNLTIWGVVPIMACDVWEHAYYLKYQNRRGEYIKNFFHLVNWKNIMKKYEIATK